MDDRVEEISKKIKDKEHYLIALEIREDFEYLLSQLAVKDKEIEKLKMKIVSLIVCPYCGKKNESEITTAHNILQLKVSMLEDLIKDRDKVIERLQKVLKEISEDMCRCDCGDGEHICAYMRAEKTITELNEEGK